MPDKSIEALFARLEELQIENSKRSYELHRIGALGEATALAKISNRLRILPLARLAYDFTLQYETDPPKPSDTDYEQRKKARERNAAELKKYVSQLKKIEKDLRAELAKPLPKPEAPEDPAQEPEPEPKPTPKKKAPAPPAPTIQNIQAFANKRTKLIDDIIEGMEGRIDKAQEKLLRDVLDDFMDELDVDENGNIKNTLANKRKLSLVDRVYNQFIQTEGVKIADTIVRGVTSIMNFNGQYYSMFTKQAQLGKIMDSTRETIGDWLGVTNRGGLVENGYLRRLISDPGTRDQIRSSTLQNIVGQKGFFQAKAEMKAFIDGGTQNTGILKQYYRNFVYDTFSQVDRVQAKTLSDSLKFRCAIYEGGIIKTSREFCRKRNGKVFTREEIEKFNPPVAKPPNYNPFTDLGGYGCRHHLNWIPDAVAFALRPELRQILKAA